MFMDLVLMILLILSCLCIGLLFLSTYMLRRNEKVKDFCFSLVDMAYEYEIRRLKEYAESGEERTEENAFDWFANKHSYEDYLYSFKPLKLESWFTEEEIKEINR